MKKTEHLKSKRIPPQSNGVIVNRTTGLIDMYTDESYVYVDPNRHKYIFDEYSLEKESQSQVAIDLLFPYAVCFVIFYLLYFMIRADLLKNETRNKKKVHY